jgi:hypothetical protein
MQTLEGRAPQALLERPVFNAEGHLMGRVAAVGTRHGELRRIGIETPGPEPTHLHFVACRQFTIERDRVVLAP